MSPLRKFSIAFFAGAFAFASLALLGTIDMGHKLHHVWPLRSHLFLPNLMMGSAWLYLGLGFVGVTVWLLLGDKDNNNDRLKKEKKHGD